MKDVPKVDRPREKLSKYGPGKLSDSELLAILLRTGTKESNVLEFAEKLLKKLGSEGISTASVGDLEEETGIGQSKASEIVACFELGRRTLKDKQAELILSPEDVFNQMQEYKNHKREHLVVFFLDTRSQEIKREVVAVGTLTQSLVHPREVFEPAIRHSAAHIIVAHNHPSGDPTPSADDKTITANLKQAGEILGIELKDHVIVAADEWYSCNEHGLV